MNRVKKFWLITVSALLAAFIVIAMLTAMSGLVEPEYQGKKLTGWIEDLRNPSPLIQTNAVVAIRQIGTNAIPFLVEMLHAKDSAFKIKGVDLLQRQHWIKFNYRWDFQKRSDALLCFRTLGSTSTAAISEVAKLLDQSSDSKIAAYTLSQIGSNAVPALNSALTNPHNLTRMHAVQMIGRTADSSSTSNLLEMLHDSDFLVRSSAINALCRFPEKADVIVPALIELLDDTDNTLRGNAARGLGRFGDAGKPAIPKLMNLAESTDYHLRMTAAGVLMKLDFDGTLAVFTNKLKSSEVNVRRSTASVLMLFKSAGRPAVPALVKCLKDTDTEVRLNAAVTLREIGEEADMVVPALMENLNDPDLKLRSITAIALRSFGERAKPAVPAILKLIEENNDDRLMVSGLFNALYDIDPEAAAKLTEK